MSQIALVTGAYGYTGSYLRQRLGVAGTTVRSLTNHVPAKASAKPAKASAKPAKAPAKPAKAPAKPTKAPAKRRRSSSRGRASRLVRLATTGRRLAALPSVDAQHQGASLLRRASHPPGPPLASRTRLRARPLGHQHPLERVVGFVP